MPRNKKRILQIFITLLIVYFVICTALYLFQERIIFLPEKLDKSYRYNFDLPFEEMNIATGDGQSLNGLLFRAENSKGLIFYLHGNAGSLADWGYVAERYTALQYSVFILDYPGYGKSTGSIRSKEQLLGVVQEAYDFVKTGFDEDSIIILGYSIGTGPAAHLASKNHPRLLILQAPYYSLADLVRHTFKIVPTFLLRYNFETAAYAKECKVPIIIFHGDRDEVIYYKSSEKLISELKPTDKLITLKGQGHNGITDNPYYLAALTDLLK
ncbi:MAG: alpha/beta fold hydrolase [Chitinophagaceae bacterium]|nr:alpha/beta fold hydrolase [Chitinophagaceae bacterium]